MLQQHIAQGNDRSGLTGAGGHNQQGFAAVLLVKGIADGFDSTFLVVAACDVLLHHDIFQGGTHGAKVEHLT